MADKRDVWFPAKRFGWGWGLPVKWQGWVALFIYVAVILLTAVRLPPARELPAFLALVFVATVVFGLLCWWKGEPPRWRWGEEERDRVDGT